MPGDRSGDDGVSTPDYRQVAFVSLAVVGIVVAAFLAPPVPNASGPESAGSGAGNGFLSTILRLLAQFLSGGGGGGGGGVPACRILLHDDPTAGHMLTVTVLHDGEPVEDATVWYNDQRVGKTDARGDVTGTVPYRQKLRIRVVHEDLVGCSSEVDGATARVRADGGRRLETASVGVGDDRIATAGTSAGMTVGATAEMPTASALGSGGSAGTHFARSQEDDDPNESVTHDVYGRIDVEVRGEPYPGETVTVEATVKGSPVQEGTVRVDGDRVGTTNELGRLAVRVPDDGSDEMRVTVSKGDFSGGASVNVLLLQVRLRPEGLLLVPGGDATAVATLGDRPADGATMTVAGRPEGSVDGDGTHPVTVPTDPTTAVRVETERQTASVSLVDVYWLPASLFSLFVLAAATLAYRFRGIRAVGGVLVGVAAPLVVVVVQSYLGNPAAYATAGGFLITGVLAAAVYWRRRVAGGAASAGSALPRVAEWIVARLLWLADGIGNLVDHVRGLVGRFVTWVRTLPRSASGLVREVIAAVTTHARWILVAVLVVVVPVAGYVVDDWRGFAIGLGGLVLAGLVVAWWYASRSSRFDSPGRTGETVGSPEDESFATSTDGVADLSLRELWREFARRVVPGDWRTRTVGEVARKAVDAGYPAEPVRALATAVREVEYGERSLGSATRDGVEAAYETLVDAEGDGDGNDGGYGTSDPEPELEGETT